MQLPLYSPCRIPEKEFLKAFKSAPRLKTKVNNFHKQMASNNNAEDEFVAIRPEWTTVDRIIACRFDYPDLEFFGRCFTLPSGNLFLLSKLLLMCGLSTCAPKYNVVHPLCCYYFSIFPT